jgi:tetratricopeptide (TPR) repeat protein
MDDFAEAWGNDAVALAMDKKNEEARIAFDKASALFPQLEKLAVNKGAFELGIQEYARALETYHKGLVYVPDDPDLRYGYAVACYSLGRLDSAEIILQALASRSDTSLRAAQLAERIRNKRNLR